jgi:aconitate hydratase
MGVLPLQWLNEDTAESVGIKGDETFAITGLTNPPQPNQEVTLEITQEGKTRQVKLLSRLDTPSEIEYYQQGGILPYILRQRLKKS